MLLLGKLGWDASSAVAPPPPDPNTWFEALAITLNPDAPTAVSNRTLRMRYAAPPLNGPGGDRIRFRVRGPTTGSITINQAWIGRVAKATSGMPMSDGVQVTFANGSNAIVVGAGEQIFSDAITFSMDPETHDLVLSFFIPTGSGQAPVADPSPSGVLGINVSGNSANSSGSLGTGVALAWLVELVQGNAEYVPPGLPYVPPTGDALVLNFTGVYTPPAGDSLVLNFEN